MTESLVTKAKEVVVQSRQRSDRTRKTKLPREDYVQVAMSYLRGEISLTQILIAGDYKSNDVNSAYRIIAIGCRLAVEDGLLGEAVEAEEGVM